MSLKDNFYQAMKELMNNGGLVGSDLEEKAKGPSELDAYLETPAAAPGAEVPPYQQQRGAQSQQSHAQAAPQSPYARQYASATQEPAREAETETRDEPYGYDSASSTFGETERGEMPYYRQASGFGQSSYESQPQEMTIISKNTLVDGNIRSFANIAIQGNVRGSVSITKDAFLSGKVIGDVKCSNMEMLGSSIQGDVTTKGRAMLDGDSLLLGALNAQYADVNGKVKGNMEITGKAEFRSDAVILGDINTSAITVMDGANIQGFINTTYLKDNADKVFPGKVSIGEEDFTAQEAAQ